MDLQDRFSTQLVQKFVQNGFIKAMGRGLWALTEFGGSLIHYAIAVGMELAYATWHEISERIRNRGREGNGILATIFDLLGRFGGNSFETIVKLISRAIEFLMNLTGMARNAISSTSSPRNTIKNC